MAAKRLHMFVSGMVQGVYYRANAQDKAMSLGLTGWVRNLLDGRVEILAEGDEKKLEELYEYCRNNPGMSKVDDVVASWEKPSGGFREFGISYVD